MKNKINVTPAKTRMVYCIPPTTAICSRGTPAHITFPNDIQLTKSSVIPWHEEIQMPSGTRQTHVTQNLDRDTMRWSKKSDYLRWETLA